MGQEQVSAEAATSAGQIHLSRPFWISPGASPTGPHPADPPLTALCLPAGVQSREKPPEESSVPARRRTPSDSHYEKSSPEPSSPRSPTVLSPEVVSTIAANPGGRPKEVRTGRLPPGRGKAWGRLWDLGHPQHYWG